MKKNSIALLLLIISINISAQDVAYKKGLIQVDGKEYAKVEVKNENFGLTKSFEVYTMSGKKIIIAAAATEFEQDKTDNTYLFYRLTFLTSNQVGIFKVSSLGQEKSFAKLIGNSGIIEADSTSDTRVREFIALKSASPRIAVNYNMVSRNRGWPVKLQQDKNIEQDGKIIGSFKPTGSSNQLDHYEFLLLSGVVMAKLSFAGGNNAQNFELFTAKDNFKRMVPIPTDQKIILADTSKDKNQFTLQRIAKWLVENQYL